MIRIALLDADNPRQAFPSIHTALAEPNGLLAVGGCLSKLRLMNAYQQGIFPWYNPGEPILWWSPDPRLVLFPEQLHISRSLSKTLRKNMLTTSFDQCFTEVMLACAKPRKDASGTWISQDMLRAYQQLHAAGIAHSIEVWQNDKLVGGLYGVAIGQVFFGESMFHTQTDASKIALVTLVQQLKTWRYQLIDCQVQTQHLMSLGAQEITRKKFAKLLNQYCIYPPAINAWQP